MERNVKLWSSASNDKRKVTFIIDKNGLRLENKEPMYMRDDEAIKEFLADCINDDGWFNSWYLDMGKAKAKGSKERKELYRLLNEKIENTEQRLQKFKDAKQILRKWKY